MNKYETRRLRLQSLIDDQCDGKNSSFANKTGIDGSYVSRMLYPEGKKGKKRIGEDTIEKVIAAFGLPIGWLDGPVPISAESIEKLGEASPTAGTDIEIREYNGIGGSMGGGLVLPDQPGEIRLWRVTQEWVTKNIKSHTGTENLRIVTGFGDSMRPLFNPGDPLLVDSGIKSVDFDSIYFFRIGDEGFIKRLQRVPGEGLIAISENKAYRNWAITPNMDFEVFAHVIKVWCGTDF